MPNSFGRFMKKVAVEDDRGCWMWTASCGSHGYGQFQDGGVVLAHRWSYEHFVEPIPPGLVVHHICYERRCVNPDHLRAVTQRENLLDPDSSSPARRSASATQCPQGHPYDEANTGVSGGKRYCRACKSQRHAAWAKRNRSRLNKYHRQWRASR